MNTITVTPIRKDIEIVTDLQAMSDIVDAANSLSSLERPDPAPDTTEAEASQTGREYQTARDALADLIGKADATTLVMTLQGLGSSPWNAIVLQHTTVDGTTTAKDWTGILKDALPRMLTATRWKASGQPVSFEPGALETLLDSLVDTQVADCIRTIQELNTPIDTVPKAARSLIA